MPPLLPQDYNKELALKNFLYAKEDIVLLVDLYQKGFSQFFNKVLKLTYSNLQWGDEEAAQMAGILASGELRRLEWLHLASNEIGDEGMLALAESLTYSNTPSITCVVLEGNPGDPSPVIAALARIAEQASAAKPAKLATVGEKERAARRLRAKQRLAARQMVGRDVRPSQVTTVIATKARRGEAT